jgi:hypothetical protein
VKKLGLALTAVIAVAMIVSGWWWHKYPYGWSHSCDVGVWLQLLGYADAHDGWLPRGESCPEASLSLLSRTYPVDAEWLRGKSVPCDVVDAILKQGGLLGPDSCGWNYIEGLRSDDPGELLVLWDKAGLGHNGERLNGCRDVILLHGSERVPLGDGPAFLNRQREMLSPAATAETSTTITQ